MKNKFPRPVSSSAVPDGEINPESHGPKVQAEKMIELFSRSYSRRALMLGLASGSLVHQHSHVLSREQDISELGHGIEMRDFRLFPSPDIMRFIVEVHNTTHTSVDTPTIGVLLPHLNEEENYAWATPMAPVLHPHTSGGLIGVAPSALASNSDWGEPEWRWCRPLRSRYSDEMAGLKLSLSHIAATEGSDYMEITASVANEDALATPELKISGLVWDEETRLCGATPTAAVPGISPFSTINVRIRVAPEKPFNTIANPFTLVDTVEGMDVTLSLQPLSDPVAPGCPAIMPWNR